MILVRCSFLCRLSRIFCAIKGLHMFKFQNYSMRMANLDSFCILVSVTVFVILVCSISPVLNGVFKAPLKFNISSFKRWVLNAGFRRTHPFVHFSESEKFSVSQFKGHSNVCRSCVVILLNGMFVLERYTVTSRLSTHPFKYASW